MNINLLFPYFRLGFEVKMNRFNKNTVLNQCHKKKQYEKDQNLLLFLKINSSYMHGQGGTNKYGYQMTSLFSTSDDVQPCIHIVQPIV